MLVIRKAAAADVPVILALVRELAAYEREPHAVEATEGDYLRDGFGKEPAFHVLLAEEGGHPIGFAFWFFTYSTWTGTKVVHLEDLFVKPEARGHGTGLALMRALAKEAKDAGCKRFVWNVLDWNTTAIRFYEKLGAKVLPEWRSVRIEGAALDALAAAC
jgi:GNAT superfamily N-acetyltransferase